MDCRDDDVELAWEDGNELGNGLLVPDRKEVEEESVEEVGEFEEDDGKEVEPIF